MDRLETIMEYQNATEERKQRIHVIELQQDRMLTVWHLLQDKMSVPLPPRPPNRFNSSLQDILRNRAAPHLEEEDASVVQRVLDQPRLKDLTVNSGAESPRETLRNLTLAHNMTSASEQDLIRRTLGDAYTTGESTRPNLTNVAKTQAPQEKDWTKPSPSTRSPGAPVEISALARPLGCG